MEASLPSSSVRETGARIPATAASRPAPSSSGSTAPSAILPVGLPLRFIVTGILSLVAAALGIVLWPDILATYHYNQEVLAITHLITLGWLGSVVMGATYQLVPVALETRLHSQRLVRWHFWMHLVGVLGMVAMFRVWNMKQVGHFGSLVAVGFGCFIYNLARTLRTIPRWTPVAAGIASSLGWLGATGLAGLYVACAKCWTFSPFDPISQMHAHAHLGVIGFFLLLLVAVSFRLLPMFCLGKLASERRAGWTIGLLNAGVLAVFVTVLLGSRGRIAAGLLTLAGISLYLLELRAILRSRKRRPLDWALRAFLAGVGLLVPVAGLGLFLGLPGLLPTEPVGRLENTYGMLALLGVLTLPIVGMLHKIVPFLVWQSVYSPLVGIRKVPLFTDLYSPRLLQTTVLLLLAGLGAMIGAALLGSAGAVRAGGLVFAAGTLTLLANMARILRHLVRPAPLDPASEQRPTALPTVPANPRSAPAPQVA